MRKHSSEDAYFERLRTLADVNKGSIKEPQTRNLGTLIDYRRAADGVAYGIIKEGHNYYIKKAGTKQDPDVADFAYIGGLANITEYQYKKLSEADKQRNMIFCTINEAVSLKPSKTGSKKKLNEDRASDEIEKASSKIGDLDAATNVEATPETPEDTEVPIEPAPEGGEETEPVSPEGGEGIPAPEGSEGGEEVPAPEGGEGEEPEGGEEVPAPEGGEGEEPEGGEGEEPEGESKDEIKSDIGKIGEKILNKTLDDKKVKDYVSMFLGYFTDNFVDMPIADRKKLAKKILEVGKEKSVSDLEATMPSEPVEDNVEEEGVCAECGSFGKYAESRGYTKESLMECGEEEMSNVVSGYANAYNDGQNDGDFKLVALLVTPEMLGKLKDDYGHDDYTEKLTPYVNQLGECKIEERQKQIDELWGGLKNLGKSAIGGIKAGAQKVGQAVGGAVKAGAQKVGQAAQAVKQTYHAGEVPAEIKKLENIAIDLGKQVAALNTRLQKAGQQPVNVNSILQSITNQLGRGSTATVGHLVNQPQATQAAEGYDVASVETQPNMLKEVDEPENDETPEHEEGEAPEEEKAEHEPGGEEFAFGTDAQNLGVDTIKPDGAPTNSVDVNVDAQNKTVNVSMQEAKKRLIKQIAEGVNQFLNEKWKEDVEIKKTGEHAGKSVEKIDKELSNLKKKSQSYQDKDKKVPDEVREKQSELNFAKRAKTGWKQEESAKISESEEKLRKYIRARLEEKAGLRKSRLSESKKSSILQKLDATIDEQFKLYESVVTKKNLTKK